jgi:hypothetical protein
MNKGSPNRPNCTGNHGLKLYHTPNDKMVCSLCTLTQPLGAEFFGCKACKTTVCRNCYGKNDSSAAAPPPPVLGASSSSSSGSGRNCVGGHGLKTYQVPSGTMSCNECNKQMNKGDSFHGCKSCKTRLCSDCFER